METTQDTTIPVMITENAVKELIKAKKDNDIPENLGLRLGVKAGGCSGYSYVMGFDEKQENDEVFDLGDINLYIQESHLMYLAGLEIDWVDGLENRGFSFTNPNASKSCGCGNSFDT